MQALELEQKQALDTEVVPAARQAVAMVVSNHEERGVAADFVKGLRELKVKIEERFKPTANRKKAPRNMAGLEGNRKRLL